MLSLLENEFVEKKGWLTKEEFLDMVAIAESTPGPVAINSATFVGYKVAGFCRPYISCQRRVCPGCQQGCGCFWPIGCDGLVLADDVYLP